MKHSSGIVGLSGELALQSMSKKDRKKFLDAKRQEEEEEKQLKERILKAKQDMIEQAKQQKKDEQR